LTGLAYLENGVGLDSYLDGTFDTASIETDLRGVVIQNTAGPFANTNHDPGTGEETAAATLLTLVQDATAIDATTYTQIIDLLAIIKLDDIEESTTVFNDYVDTAGEIGDVSIVSE